ncbi:uncharacterized protein LOC116804928 [Drosophila grimshawi]|uniref:GH10392 n=1 Tax=Drosophila grimshawi TaxID=7222 RepID=B4JEC5_DROGR|nr:uncharacterized protein LOC116804928 [Drosophila grimshawi]EDW03645.1 GH10392 [Drosophila grimshawi]
MCGGWACASYSLACNNPQLSTLRFTGRDFIPTPCGPHDKCFAKDTSCTRGNCNRPQGISVEMNPCLDLTKTENREEGSHSPNQAKENWKTAFEKVLRSPAANSK